MEIEILSPTEAADEGYLSLTTSYNQSSPKEVQWMKNVLNDLKGCRVVLIETGTGYEVARHRSEITLLDSMR
jgi:hypothetical protein